MATNGGAVHVWAMSVPATVGGVGTLHTAGDTRHVYLKATQPVGP